MIIFICWRCYVNHLLPAELVLVGIVESVRA